MHLKSQCQYRLDGAGSWWVRFRHARKSCFVESTLGYFNDDTNRKISNHWCVLVLWTRLDVVYFPQLILQELKEEKDQFLLLKSRTKRNSCMRWTSTLEELVRFSIILHLIMSCSSPGVQGPDCFFPSTCSGKNVAPATSKFANTYYPVKMILGKVNNPHQKLKSQWENCKKKR